MADKYQLLPPLSTQEQEQLEISIVNDGCLDPIEFDEDGNILDGHHRYEICTRRGVEFKSKVVGGLRDELEKKAYVFKRNENAKGRSLSPEQKAELRKVQIELAKELKEAKYTQKQIGDLLGVAQQRISEWLNGSISNTESGITYKKFDSRQKLSKEARQDIFERAEAGETQEQIAADYKISQARISQIVNKEEKAQKSIDDLRSEVQGSHQPSIILSSAIDFINTLEPFDLLLTDPPYQTDVEDIYKFAEWLPVALSKLKPTGRAYIFTGAYPQEIHAYLNQATPDQILVWTYRNTIGPNRKKEYKSNWQTVLYFIGKDAPDLKGDMLKEKFATLDFNAPDGRHGKRWHPWEKPLDLAEQLILQSTNENDLVVDPFAGTGTFLLAAGKLGRIARGCDQSEEMINICKERGIEYIQT